jgi:hypothetical protein
VEISPARLAQVQTARGGQFVEITDDVQNVAADLAAIDPGLRLRYSEAGGYFVVYHVQELPDGKRREHLVTTAQELDQRLVQRIRAIDARTGYDYARELDRLEREAEQQRDREFSERTGPIAERLAHAVRHDLGVQSRIFVPGRDKAA